MAYAKLRERLARSDPMAVEAMQLGIWFVGSTTVLRPRELID